MANSTLDALNALSNQVPGLNQRALKQVQAAQDIGLQKQIQAALTTQPIAQQAGQLASTRAIQAGQALVQQRQQAQQRAGQIRAAALQERQRIGQARLQQQQQAQQARLQQQELARLAQLRRQELESKKTELREEVDTARQLQQLGIDQDNRLQMATIKQREDLQRVGLDLKGKLLDSRLQFQRDARGRKFTNERQLSDFITTTAINKQDLNQKLSQMKQEFDKKILIMQQAQAQLQAALERGYLKEQDDLDFQAQRDLAEMNNKMKSKIRQQQARARNMNAIFSTAGAVVGGVYGGPAGAAAGAAAGGAIGGLFQ